MTLYLTPTRHELLLHVHAGNVVQGPDEQGNVHTWLIDPPYKPRKANGQIDELKRAGWVELFDHEWHLTDAGLNVLHVQDGAP